MRLVEGKAGFVLDMKKREDKEMVTFICDWFCNSNTTVWKKKILSLFFSEDREYFYFQ